MITEKLKGTLFLRAQFSLGISLLPLFITGYFLYQNPQILSSVFDVPIKLIKIEDIDGLDLNPKPSKPKNGKSEFEPIDKMAQTQIKEEFQSDNPDLLINSTRLYIQTMILIEIVYFILIYILLSSISQTNKKKLEKGFKIIESKEYRNIIFKRLKKEKIKTLFKTIWKYIKLFLTGKFKQYILESKAKIFLGIKKVPWLKESTSMFISGQTGSGKTQLNYDVLNQLFSNNINKYKMIIFEEKVWDYAANYLHKDDYILSFEEEVPNAVFIDILREVSSTSDIMFLTEVMYPEDLVKSGTDKHFRNAALTLFKTVAFHLFDKKELSIINFVDFVRIHVDPYVFDNETKETQQKYNIDAHTYLYKEGKMNNDVYTSFKEAIDKFFPIELYRKSNFSLKEFITNENIKSKLFIQKPANNYELVKPYLNLIFMLVFKTEKSLPKSKTRKIYQFLDEFQNLGNLAPKNSDYTITKLLSVQRDKGIVTFLSTNSFLEVAETYNDKEFIDRLMGYFGTKIFFRADGNKELKSTIEYFGKNENVEYKESVAVSPKSHSQNVQKQTTKESVFENFDLMNLKDLNALMRDGEYIVKLEFKFHESKEVPVYEKLETPVLNEIKIKQADLVEKEEERVETTLTIPSMDEFD